MTESFSWQHGVFMASNVASEGTAAAENKVGELRRDPFAMLPFCGYNMGDYFAHWLSVGAATDADKLPKIYNVNWFRKDTDGKYVWPGFGDNSRVLKWIVDRLEGDAEGVETPIGMLPTQDSLDLDGLELDQKDLDLLLTVDTTVWKEEAALIPAHYERFGEHLPKALWDRVQRPRHPARPGLTPSARHPAGPPRTPRRGPAVRPGRGLASGRRRRQDDHRGDGDLRGRPGAGDLPGAGPRP